MHSSKVSLACGLFLSVILSCSGSAYAQNAEPISEKADSFADIAKLGEEIAIAQRKMQAMTLKNSLDALEAQQAMGNFAFKVVRVEGFDDTLYAVLMDDKGVVYQVGPGDLVANQYRVSLIRPYSVAVSDINTRKTYSVPFVIGGVGSFIGGDGYYEGSESIASSAVNPQTVVSK